MTQRKGPGCTAGLRGLSVFRINGDEMTSPHSLSLILIKSLGGRLLILLPALLVRKTRSQGLVTGPSSHSW